MTHPPDPPGRDGGDESDRPDDPHHQPPSEENAHPASPGPGDAAGAGDQQQDEEGFTQRVRNQQVSARVPESIGRGTFASTALVITGNHEFIVDFLQSVTRPQQVAARVILPASILASTIRALEQNIDNYTNRFGEIPELPTRQDISEEQRQQQKKSPPSVEEIYEQLKIPEDVATGAYANTVMITHGPTEFCFDFIASFYPRSTVTNRIYMAAPQVPRILGTFRRSLEQYKQQVAKQQERARQQQQQQADEAASDPTHPTTDPPATGEAPPDTDPPAGPGGPDDTPGPSDGDDPRPDQR